MDTVASHDVPVDGQSQARGSLTRNQIACEMCRQHKQRCDGTSPCSKCAQRGVTCTYRAKKRPHRKSRTTGLSVQRKSTARAAGRRNLFPSVRASQNISATSVCELYYGPSSNFSLMQHLYRQLVHDRGGLQPHSGDVQDAGDGLDEFHYRNVCFHPHQAKVGQAADDHLPVDHSRYLDAYFETVGVLFPVIREADLRSWLSRCEGPDRVDPDPIHRAVLLAALAVGALFCNAKDEGEKHLQAVQRIADESRHIINTEIVILNFLMISRPPLSQTKKIFAEFLVHALFYDITGRYNLAYLQNGHASRVAHAVGLHQVSPRLPSNTTTSQAGHTIYCALFVQESFLCTALGRPAALQFEGSSIAEPQDFPFLRYFVQFAKVTSAIKEMHQNQDQSLEAFSKTCSRLVHRLHNIAHSASESLGVDFSQRLQVKDCGVHPVLLKLEYELAMMLVHRPLLIFQTVSARSREHTRDEDDAGRHTAATTRVDGLDGAAKAVEAARRLILTVDDVLLEKNYTAHFSKLAFYLESACFVLIFDSLNSQEPLMVNSHHVEKAVGVLAKLNNKTSALNITVGIRTMLDRALTIALSTMHQDRNSPAEASSTGRPDLREVTRAVEVGLEQADMKALLEWEGSWHFLES